jgi:hypothetical protein
MDRLFCFIFFFFSFLTFCFIGVQYFVDKFMTKNKTIDRQIYHHVSLKSHLLEWSRVLVIFILDRNSMHYFCCRFNFFAELCIDQEVFVPILSFIRLSIFCCLSPVFSLCYSLSPSLTHTLPFSSSLSLLLSLTFCRSHVLRTHVTYVLCSTPVRILYYEKT